MQDNEKSWKERFDRMKDYYGYGLEDIAEITGNSHGSVRTVLNREEFPRWLKLAVVNFELEREREIEKDPDLNPSIFE